MANQLICLLVMSFKCQFANVKRRNVILSNCVSFNVTKDWFQGFDIFTIRNEVAKVMFLHLSVCPQGGITWAGTLRDQVHPPGPGTPPWDQVYPHWDQVHPPGPGTPPGQVPPYQVHPRDQVHPPSRQLLLRTVRILVECILLFLFEVDIRSVHMVVTRTAGTDRQIDSGLTYGNGLTEVFAY